MHGFCIPVIMYRILLVIIVFLFTIPVSAQGNVEVITDPSVEALESARIAKRKSNNGKVSGYRIMIAFYSSREAANEKLSEVKSWFGSSYGAALLYDEPNFKVYSGEFTSKADAEAALVDIRKRYPGARIVSDLVSPPRVH
jgi:SPOR domain